MGDQTPYHCEVYFINKTEQMSIKWGTDSQVQYMEPVYKFPLKIGASGEMTLRVEESRKLLVKIVGTERTLNQASLTQMFRSFLMARIKPYLAQTMQNSAFSIFEVDSQMMELSGVLHNLLRPDFDDYGLSLEKFFVTTIVKPDGDRAYESFKDIHIRQYTDVANAQLRQRVGIIDQQTDAQRMVIESAAIAQKRAQEGYSYQQERGYDVAEKVAENESVGSYSNAGIGLGMMGGVAGGMGAVVAGITSTAINPTLAPFQMHAQQQPQPQPQSQSQSQPQSQPQPQQPPPPLYPSQSLPPQPPPAQSTPAEPSADDMDSFKQKLQKLKMMKDLDMLSESEYEEERKRLLSGI
jgi:hypothetical protein